MVTEATIRTVPLYGSDGVLARVVSQPRPDAPGIKVDGCTDAVDRPLSPKVPWRSALTSAFSRSIMSRAHLSGAQRTMMLVPARPANRTVVPAPGGLCKVA